MWQVAGFVSCAAATAALTARWMIDSSRWCLRIAPERGSRLREGAGKTYCQAHCRAAPGYFCARAPGRKTSPYPSERSDDVGEARKRLPQDVPVEEEEGAQCLVLGRGRHVLADREVREKGVDLGLAHFVRMPLAVEQDEALHPGHVSLLCSEAVVARSDRDPDTFEKARLLRLVRRRLEPGIGRTGRHDAS